MVSNEIFCHCVDGERPYFNSTLCFGWVLPLVPSLLFDAVFSFSQATNIGTANNITPAKAFRMLFETVFFIDDSFLDDIFFV